MNIVAVDPGTSNTGIVYMNERRIICAKTLHYKSTVKDDQYALRERADNIARQLLAWVADKPHEVIVMEGFVGGYRGRQGGYVFQTPYLCGFLHAALRGERIAIQTSRQVLNPKSRGNMAELRALMERGANPYPGCEHCTNDHLRAAACHGAYYLARKLRPSHA
jgi:hypothetical protein